MSSSREVMNREVLQLRDHCQAVAVALNRYASNQLDAAHMLELVEQIEAMLDFGVVVRRDLLEVVHLMGKN